MHRILAEYKNGNYLVRLYDDGTKIKTTPYDEFIADFPDSVDLKITSYCENDCPMCHESSSKNGAHADLDNQFTDTFISGMEIAIGGGNPLSHPDLLPFLRKLKGKRIIANMTVNQIDLAKQSEFLEYLLDKKLIHGLGISMDRVRRDTVDFAKKHKNVVLHLINGVFPVEEYPLLYDQGLKILILGYKRFGKGESFYSEKVADTMAETARQLNEMTKRFLLVSFDNLALEQLNVKQMIGEEKFNEIYMGADGESSMYVDLVKREYALSSTATQRYPLEKSLKKCFHSLRKTNKPN